MGKKDKRGRGRRLVNYIIDTNIFVDALRRYSPAIKFLDSLDEIVIPSLVLFELFKGTKNKRELTYLRKRFENAKTIYLDEHAQEVALDIYAEYRPRLEINIIDSLIAGTCVANNMVLVTRDKRHFSKIKGLKVMKPY